ncbi:MAG: hypothetical protein JO323_12660 [Acidobacteriia bacterium]|nr:hypothetical protein [Terriglobia bacterium]
MPRDESFDAEFERLKRQLQDAILRDYPNPERKGCPGDAALKELATGPFDEASLENNPHWQHVTHCSECYREFLGFRGETKREAHARRIRSWLLAALLVLCIVGAFFGVREFQRTNRPQIAELTFRRRVVYLEGVTRSAEPKGEEPLVFEREPEELTIRLPLASPEGTYEIQIERTAGNPLLAASGQAKMENGITAFTIKLDFSKLESGDYFMCVRRVPLRSVCHPMTIR